jgi:hypothetical protein
MMVIYIIMNSIIKYFIRPDIYLNFIKTIVTNTFVMIELATNYYFSNY